MARILVCDDDRSLCTILEIKLRKDGHKVETVNSREAAKTKIGSSLFDVIVTDIRMPSTADGMEVLRYAREVSPETAVVLVTAVGELDTAITALRAGAFDYILKEPDLVERVTLSIRRAVELSSLRQRVAVLQEDAAKRNSLENLVGTSPAVEKLKQTIRTVAATTSTVVIQGESGTGKELVARAIHTCSGRAEQPFVSVNCGAFPETLLESELFGYMKGAFTGATQNKRGLFEVADGGTLFLDEISETSLAMQVKLLRVLQERRVRPIGGAEEIAVDVRVIAATNRDLDQLVAENSFREDLYYRLSVIPVYVPPLRQRREDIPQLAAHFLKRFARAAGKDIAAIAQEDLDQLVEYNWPGNVRQLENTVERAVAMESGTELHVELPVERAKARAAAAGASVNGEAPSIPSDGLDMERYIAHMEKSLIQTALRQSGGVQTRAAEILKLSYRSFRHLMKKYEL